MKGVQSLLPGSVSKYCLQQSPIPVIVVRPSQKREKKKKKRRADPTRRSYNHILELSEQRGSRIFGATSSNDSSTSKLPDEEAAVAEALGLPASYSNMNSRSSLSVSDRSSISHDDSDSTTPARNSLDAVIMKSPLGSPADSSQESVAGESQTALPLDGPAENDSSSDSSSTTEGDKSDNGAPVPVSIPSIEVSADDNDKKS
jgi:hypothetical protein